MWIVAKIKKKELHIFKKELSKEFGVEIKFYNPKIEYHKYYGDKVKSFKKTVKSFKKNSESFNKQ